MARLQIELCTKDYLLSYEFSIEKCSEFFPDIFEPLFCGSQKSRKIPTKFPSKFPCEKIDKIHRQASPGVQGEPFAKSPPLCG